MYPVFPQNPLDRCSGNSVVEFIPLSQTVLNACCGGCCMQSLHNSVMLLEEQELGAPVRTVSRGSGGSKEMGGWAHLCQ